MKSLIMTITTIFVTFLLSVNAYANKSTYTDNGNNRTRIIQWYSDYECYEYTYSIEINKSIYNQYRNNDNRSYISITYNEYFDDYNNLVLKDFANKMQTIKQQRNFNDYQFITDILRFVQSIPYESDLQSTGHQEWPKYPIETLYENCGDCEDKAILLAGILKECGYDVSFIQLTEHIVVGINVPYEGTYATYNNKNYIVLEATSEGWNIGQLSRKFDAALVIPIKE